MNTKHTPGPWNSYELAGQLRVISHGEKYESETARTLCEAADRLRGTDELLPALMRLLAEVESEQVVTWGAVRATRAAIAKATGVTP